MGLSRRQFTREFKLAAIERLESGASVAEVARAFEVNPNTLHRWRRDFRQGPANPLPPGATSVAAPCPPHAPPAGQRAGAYTGGPCHLGRRNYALTPLERAHGSTHRRHADRPR